MTPAPPSPKPARDPDRKEPPAMKSALKIILPLGLLLAVVFAVTYLARYTPPDDEVTTKQDPNAIVTGKGLEFFTTTRRWDPATFSQIFAPESSVSLQDVAFPGFFEPGEVPQATHFWFRNRNPGKVRLRLLGVSCSSCSGGRVAPIPPEAARALLQMAAVSALPLGPVGACPPGMAGTGAFLTNNLKWEAHAFKDGPVEFHVPPPADADGWSPGWGILELNFKVKASPMTLKAGFATLDEANTPVDQAGFTIEYAPAVGVEVDKSAIDAGELADNTPAQTHWVTAYSPTRTRADLPDLSVRVVNPGGGDAGPFVTVGRAEPVPDDELTRLAAQLASASGKAARVRSAFRIPVTVAAKVGDARPEIGRLDRELWITANVPGLEPKKVAVKASVTGAIGIAGGATDVNLGSFKQQVGASETVVVTTDPAGAALEVVPGSARPAYVEAGLKKLPDAGSRGQWQLTVRVPPGRHAGEITDGVVVLELKGPSPQRIRIPVRGRGVQ